MEATRNNSLDLLIHLEPRDNVHLHRRPPPASTSYYSSTIDLLQPPSATVHPRAPVHPATTARYSTGYCSTSPLHGVLFNHPSTGYCSSSPPLAIVQPALHGVLFIHPQPTRSIRVLFIQRQHHGSCSSTPTAHCSSKPPATLTVHPIDRLQLAAVAKESLDRVELTAIDRSLGFSNA